MACTAGCPTQTCESYGACLRGKALKVAYCNSAGGSDYSAQKRLDKDLAFYKEARAQGVQPAGTARPQVENALRISEKTGTAYDAG
ncbi:MAG: hypothetical protein ACXVGN_00125 [Mycobacteriaceae bacterium]